MLRDVVLEMFVLARWVEKHWNRIARGPERYRMQIVGW